MRSVLDSRLAVVTGKGGVGKTTIAAALGLLASRRGLRTIVVEVGDQNRLPALFEHRARQPGVEVKLHELLSSISLDPDQALLEWLQTLGGRVSGRMLASSGAFQYFAAAAPGAKEMVSMVKVWELTQSERWQRRAAGYDLVVLDAPATGHALGMLRSPYTFGAIARVGPIHRQSREVSALLEDPQRTSFVAVALGTEMAVTEVIEIEQGLQERLGRGLAGVVVNGLLPQRFTAEELRLIAAAAPNGRPRGGAGGDDTVRAAAVAAARTVHDRARFQHNQVARLRRQSFEVLGVPFVWGGELDLPAVQRVADQLARRL